MTSQGASNNERLIAAARSDNEDLLVEIFENGDFDINYQDGLGNTALHYAFVASYGSTAVLEHILSHDDCDVDPINRLEGATPLHLAVKLEDHDLRNEVVESLLDAGADVTIKDKNGETVSDLLSPTSEADADVRALIRKSQVSAAVSADDVASDSEGEPGSGPGSDEE
ncbi:hypothetical protein PLEOSDRAFT_49912 [Pleurotus ostreatus PC15]|uniref:Peptidase A2 domain-containing protein n=1 Tax=Pleurotus ostreatus (strain PC15) TaxID=1137138 RepID=A0A067NX12_PLEO1|nr:hypothetical protein PLEOSDRAFT_49912 [Pleurotus ostreatus PC15]